MSTIELWSWRYTDDFGKRRIVRCRLTEDDALHLHKLKDAERVEGSLEVRRRSNQSTSDFQRSPPKP